MRTTLNLDDKLIAEAMNQTGIKEKTTLIHTALKSMIAEYSRKRLILLGGSDKKATVPKRRRNS
jgi:Arc/MetJ family transcription regulator